MHNRRNFIYGILILLVVALGGGAYKYYVHSKQVSSDAVQMKTTEVKRGDIAILVSATGSLASANKVDIVSKVAAQIKDVKVKENDQVVAGQELVLLDDPNLKSNLDKAEATMKHAWDYYQRQANLYRQGAVSKQLEEDAQKDYVLAQKDYENYVEQMKDIVITAPFSGTVIGEPMLVGQTVVTGYGSNPMVILAIADLSKMQVEVLASESDIGKIKQGQNVQFAVDAYQDKAFSGMVSKISNKMTTQTNSSAAYYKVTIDIANTEGLLKPGMTARVTITGDKKDNVLLVPLAAIKEDHGKKYVQVMENGNINNVSVQLGIMNEEQAEVLTGLTEGQEVVLFRYSGNGENTKAGNGTDKK